MSDVAYGAIEKALDLISDAQESLGTAHDEMEKVSAFEYEGGLFVDFSDVLDSKQYYNAVNSLMAFRKEVSKLLR